MGPLCWLLMFSDTRKNSPMFLPPPLFSLLSTAWQVAISPVSLFFPLQSRRIITMYSPGSLRQLLEDLRCHPFSVPSKGGTAIAGTILPRTSLSRACTRNACHLLFSCKYETQGPLLNFPAESRYRNLLASSLPCALFPFRKSSEQLPGRHKEKPATCFQKGFLL